MPQQQGNGLGKETADGEGTGQPVDLELLAEMMDESDPAYLADTLRYFWRTVADVPARLHEHIDSGASEILHKEAHAAKGAAASAAAQPLADLLLQLQEAAAEKNWAEINSLIGPVTEQFAAVDAFISDLPQGTGEQ